MPNRCTTSAVSSVEPSSIDQALDRRPCLAEDALGPPRPRTPRRCGPGPPRSLHSLPSCLPAEWTRFPPRAGASVVHVITDAGPHPYFRTLIESGGLGPGRWPWAALVPPARFRRTCGRWAWRRSRSTRDPEAAIPLRRAGWRAHCAGGATEHRADAPRGRVRCVGLTAARLARTPVAVMTAHHSHELPFHGPEAGVDGAAVRGPAVRPHHRSLPRRAPAR